MKEDTKKNGSSSSRKSVKREESESEEDYKPPVRPCTISFYLYCIGKNGG